jgi:hypothetical protein
MQLTSWIIFGVDVFSFCIFGIPLIETVGAKVLVSLCYAISVAALMMSAIRATGCDTSDPHVRDQAIQMQDKEHLPYCTTCNVPVFARSKHCRVCNKCVKVFDHHCMWLNNCVGDLNYRAFAMSILSVAVMTGIVLHICIYLFVDCLMSEESFEQRLDDNLIFGGVSRETALGILCAMICLNLPLFFLDMQLIVLHVFLFWHQLTTYEYIMEKKTAEELEGDDLAVAKSSEGKDRRILPDCFDWIVYKRRKKRQNKKSDQIEVLDPSGGVKSPPPEASETLSWKDQRHMDDNPTPPGSTSEAGGFPEHLTLSPLTASSSGQVAR